MQVGIYIFHYWGAVFASPHFNPFAATHLFAKAHEYDCSWSSQAEVIGILGIKPQPFKWPWSESQETYKPFNHLVIHK